MDAIDQRELKRLRLEQRDLYSQVRPMSRKSTKSLIRRLQQSLANCIFAYAALQVSSNLLRKLLQISQLRDEIQTLSDQIEDKTNALEASYQF